MLLGEHGGRHQDCRLLAVEHALHHGAQRDLSLTVADVAAEQAVHRRTALHVGLDLGDGAELIVGLFVVEGLFKFLLPRGVGRKGEARAALALSVERDETLGKVLRRGARLRLRARPVRAAELTELRAYLAVLVLAMAADVFRHHVELRRGDV